MGSRLRLVAVFAALLAMWAPSFARADGGMERQFTGLVHSERAAAGLPAYAERPDLVDVARGQAQRMAREKRLYHNPRLGEEVQNWHGVGENVGRGPSVDSIHSAFMASTSHRQEILSRDFTEVGVGVAIADDGEIWVSQVFRAPVPAEQPEPPAPAPPATASGAGPAAGPAPASPAPTTSVPVRTLTAVPTTMAPSTTTLPPPPTTTTALAPLPPPAPPAPPEVLAATHSAPAPDPPVATPPGTGSALVEVEPEVSGPARIAAALLVLVVAAQTTYVWRAQLSSDEARRHRNHASMKSSRSPSSTPWTLPVS